MSSLRTVCTTGTRSSHQCSNQSQKLLLQTQLGDNNEESKRSHKYQCVNMTHYCGGEGTKNRPSRLE